MNYSCNYSDKYTSTLAATKSANIAGTTLPNIAGTTLPTIAGTTLPTIAGTTLPTIAGTTAGLRTATTTGNTVGTTATTAVVAGATTITVVLQKNHFILLRTLTTLPQHATHRHCRVTLAVTLRIPTTLPHSRHTPRLSQSKERQFLLPAVSSRWVFAEQGRRFREIDTSRLGRPTR